MGGCLIAATNDPHWLLGWFMYAYWIGQVALGLGFVIFVHELGHFLAAKACGVKCEKFYVGFDIPVNLGLFRIPAALFKFQWGETEYGVGAIPLGGYVKMLGQDDNPSAAEHESQRTKIEGPDGHVEIDPRSYTAKSVPQRMVIISAGVIMNLIFAVIMAAFAYMLGVSYIPAQNGGTTPGSPAWAADLPIDARIVQIGEDGFRSEHLRFDKDLMIKVLLNGSKEEMKFLIDTPDAEEPQWLVLQPSSKNQDERRRPAIGMLKGMGTTVSMERVDAFGHYSAFHATPPLKTDDKIIAIDGEKVDGFYDIQRIWATRGSQPITLTVERPAAKEAGEATAKAPEVIDSVVPPNPARDLGIAVKIGPISEQGIQVNSPAAEAGLRPGDVIVQINGEPAGGALSLNERLLPLAGETIDITVVREGAEQTLPVTVRSPRMVATDALEKDAPVAVDALGIAFYATNVVESVRPGSPAEEAGMAAGDVILQARFIPANDQDQLNESLTIPGAGEGRGPFRDVAYVDTVDTGGNGYNWHLAHTRVQRSQPDTKAVITYERDKKIHETQPLEPMVSSDIFLATRGLRLQEISNVHQASFAEAWPLGLRETKESIMHVFAVLGKLLSFQLSPTNLAGAPMIFAGAVAEASQGFGRLLIFLTFLSCNLAVLNFLPIPVLDGGHMVFLIAEGLRGKPIDERLQMNLTVFGLILLLSLMVFVFALDIGRLAGIASYIMFAGLG